MRETRNSNFYRDHLDQRIQERFTGNIFESEYQKLMKVFLLLREREENKDDYNDVQLLMKKLEVSNNALKKLLSHQCSFEDSQINLYLNKVWRERFKSVSE